MVQATTPQRLGGEVNSDAKTPGVLNRSQATRESTPDRPNQLLNVNSNDQSNKKEQGTDALPDFGFRFR